MGAGLPSRGLGAESPSRSHWTGVLHTVDCTPLPGLALAGPHPPGHQGSPRSLVSQATPHNHPLEVPPCSPCPQGSRPSSRFSVCSSPAVFLPDAQTPRPREHTPVRHTCGACTHGPGHTALVTLSPAQNRPPGWTGTSGVGHLVGLGPLGLRPCSHHLLPDPSPGDATKDPVSLLRGR